ncbi:MAG: hypothetical protein KGO47_08665 [Cyanobacteria bacterium REEB417]|nr:hypothetical protein [Cyanobacteria bacterium REEB417]
MAIPSLNALWRPNSSNATNDRDLIRAWLGWPASEVALVELSQQMNVVATISPTTVPQVQAWIDEVLELEETQADAVAAGTAHLGNAEEYEGPIPGTTPTRDQQLSQAKTLTWDTSLLKARYRFGSGARATAQGQRDERIQLLISRIANALNVPRVAPQPVMGAGATLMRS